MTHIETLICSFFEILSVCCIMNVFHSKYLEQKWKAIVVSILVAVIVTATDGFPLVAGYLVNYGSIVMLLTLVTRRPIVSVFFEFCFAMAAMVSMEFILIGISNKVGVLNSLSLFDRMSHLVVVITVCIIVGMNPWMHKTVRPFYERYREPIYLTGLNLLAFPIIWVYFWDSDHVALLDDLGIVTVFLVCWILINLYLLKKMIENSQQKSMINIHNQYVEMSESLLDELYSKEHEYHKHLQAIEGFCRTEKSSKALEMIEAYIESLKHEDSGKGSQRKNINTGDGVLNAFLYSKNKEAQQCDIQLIFFPMGIFPSFPCEKYELIEVLGNLINNAFDYVKTLEDKEKRKVYLKIEEQKGKGMIQVINPYFGEIATINHMSKKGFTSKEGDRRGYGLYNVKTILNKYNGNLKIYIEADQFIAEILFE